jgi:hypothetical protein
MRLLPLHPLPLRPAASPRPPPAQYANGLVLKNFMFQFINNYFTCARGSDGQRSRQQPPSDRASPQQPPH